MATATPGNRTRVVLTLLLSLLLGGDVALARLPAAARDLPQPAQTISETRLRAEPSLRSAPLLRLPAGATIYLQSGPEDGWYQIQHGALLGYIRSGDVAAVILSDEATDTDASSLDAANSVALEQRAGNRQKRRPSKETRRKRRQEQRRAEANLRVVAATDLNLRDTPSDEGTVLATLPRTQGVAPTGEQQDGWVEVIWEGELGWVLGRHLIMIPTDTSGKSRHDGEWSRAELKEIIFAAADKYGQPRADMLRVARCESNMIPSAVNPHGGSYGLFQFKPGTWLSTPYAEYDIFDPRASANAAAWMWSVGRRREWVCQ
ncbi:MAG: SH3 domain-containing protein [Thermomicrobiales bacterium]|nr:SH3 domain-containing protein [Thermomicrobiales bacterium]